MPLGARAWIADGRRGALVAADGTIDWYCPTGVEGRPALWRLLDPAGAAVRVGPARPPAGRAGGTRRLPPSTQRYVPGTNVATTVLAASDGRRAEVVDLLPWPGPNETAPGRVVRLVRALSGPIEIEVEVLPGPGGPAVAATGEALVLGAQVVRSGVALRPCPTGRDTVAWRAVRRLDAGEEMVVTLDDVAERAHEPLAVDGAHRLVETTVAAWDSWLGPVSYDGPYRAAVERSLLVVRGLTGPGGAPAGAGTSSLPRRAGGERTEDGRWVRLSVAAGAAATLAAVGLTEDAEAAEAWLRRAVESSSPPWPAALTGDGAPVPDLEELPWAGWRASQPVVTGRPVLAVDLDLYGDVVAAVGASSAGRGPGPLHAAWPALAGGADWLADHWDDADSGVWELRRRPRHLVASRLQAWSALDRMARLARAANPLDLAATGWQEAARETLRWVEAEGIAADGGLRLEPAPADDPDAALLRVAWHGPWPAGHPIVERTVARILARLGAGALVSRYPDSVDDGVGGPDSPDLLASTWAVRALAATGRWEEAHERMQAIVALGGAIGLLADAADPLSRELLGNLPSTAVHLALIDAAVALGAGPR